MSGTKAGGIKAAATKRNDQGETIRKDGEKCKYHASKKVEDDVTPDHGDQKKIGLWQRIYRGGQTVVRGEK